MVLECRARMRFYARNAVRQAEGAPSDLAWRVIGLVNIYRLLVAGGLFTCAQVESMREIFAIDHPGALSIISATYFFAGIGLIAGQSLHWSAGETITLASGGASHLAIAGDLRIHTGQAIGLLAAAVEGQTEANTLSLVSGEGELDLQAQNDQIRIRSRDQLRIVSANAQVDLAAGKTVHLATAGGASLTIEGGNITIACPGTIRVHAAKKSFVGPVQRGYPLPQFPETVCEECILRAAQSAQAFVLR